MNLPAHNGTALQWYGTAGDGGMGLWEYLSAGIGNGHTRRAYVRAAERFALWALERGLPFRELRAPHVAAYVEQSLRELSVPTVKQHLSALRTLLDSLVRRGLLAYNPAASVRAPRYSIERGKTPSLSEGEMKRLMDSIDGDKLIDIRDRAMLSVMVYSFARVGAVIGMKTEDYLQAEGRMWFRFREKNGKRHEVPAHSEASRTVEAWIAAAGSGGNRHQPLFRAVSHAGKAGPNAMDSNDVLRMVKRRAKAQPPCEQMG